MLKMIDPNPELLCLTASLVEPAFTIFPMIS